MSRRTHCAGVRGGGNPLIRERYTHTHAHSKLRAPAAAARTLLRPLHSSASAYHPVDGVSLRSSFSPLVLSPSRSLARTLLGPHSAAISLSRALFHSLSVSLFLTHSHGGAPTEVKRARRRTPALADELSTHRLRRPRGHARTRVCVLSHTRLVCRRRRLPPVRRACVVHTRAQRCSVVHTGALSLAHTRSHDDYYGDGRTQRARCSTRTVHTTTTICVHGTRIIRVCG